jgi:hypothetical protein
VLEPAPEHHAPDAGCVCGSTRGDDRPTGGIASHCGSPTVAS